MRGHAAQQLLVGALFGRRRWRGRRGRRQRRRRARLGSSTRRAEKLQLLRAKKPSEREAAVAKYRESGRKQKKDAPRPSACAAARPRWKQGRASARSSSLVAACLAGERAGPDGELDRDHARSSYGTALPRGARRSHPRTTRRAGGRAASRPITPPSTCSSPAPLGSDRRRTAGKVRAAEAAGHSCRSRSRSARSSGRTCPYSRFSCLATRSTLRTMCAPQKRLPCFRLFFFNICQPF